MTFSNKGNLGLAAALLAAMACSGGSSEGKINVRLVDAPGDYQAITLDVQRVEIQKDGEGWIELGQPNRKIDLLTLTGGVSATLVEGVGVPAGTYGQLRLVLGPDNTVTLNDGSVHDLVVPSGQRSGVKLNAHFEVAENTTRDVFVDFDAHRSIFVHHTGASDKYILRPVVRAVDRLMTGAITGVLTDAATGAPLPGALVTAQALSTTGSPSIVRATLTGADGAYVLDLLDAGGTYHVVSQPLVGASAYGARASPAITIAEATPVVDWDAAFDQAALVGALSGAITPVATEAQADEVQLLQVLDAGGTPATFVVRTAAGVVAAGAESYAIASLPAGAYAVTGVRRTVDDAGDETVTATAPIATTVAGGATTTVDLAFP